MSSTLCPTVLHWLLHWEAACPARVYLTQPLPDGRVIDYTWAAVGDQVRRMAAHLQSLGLPAQSKIALLGKNSAHWIMADLAIGLAGYVSVPLYTTLSAETAAFILEHSDARLLLLGRLDGDAEAWRKLAGAVQLPVIVLPQAPPVEAPSWDECVAAQRPLVQPRLPQAHELATIAYTSGSTGRPKGVMHSYANMIAVADGFHRAFPLSAEDRMLSYLPLAHLAERGVVEANSLRHGCRVYFNDSLQTFSADLRRARPTLFFSVPRLWTRFYLSVQQQLPLAEQARLFASAEEGPATRRRILTELGLEHVRCALTGSAPLPAEIVGWYRELGLELLEGYGMSENFGYSHGSRKGEVRLGYVGPPAPGVECRLDDSGELLVRSPAQMLGYYKSPELTVASLTADGFLRTGDRGEIDEAGRLRITGRVKELFKTSKGKYVAPAPIENRLGSHPLIEAACVTGPGLPQAFALVVLAPGTGAPAHRGELASELEYWLSQVNDQLEDHEKLAWLVVVSEPWTIDNGCLTATLKIRRDVIEARYLPKVDAWTALRRAVIWE